jgi:sensor histidine kinase
MAIARLNDEAFDLRYKNIDLSKAKAAEALQLIDAQLPDDYAAKAKAWNSIAYSCFLTSYFDSTRIYLNKIRNIRENYAGKEIEEAISNITEARLLLRECRYAEAFIIYDSTLTLFNGVINGLKYNDCIPLKKYDHRRFKWARSDYLIGNAVLGYYYRDTELPVILRSLAEIENDPKLHIDTTQLSILYYTYAGSYEKAIPFDVQNIYNSFGYIKKGLDILENPASRNNYHLANFYQITGSILLNRGTKEWLSGKDSTQIKSYIADFNREYLVGKYGWDAIDVKSRALPLLLLKKADAIFGQYNDPYQNLASSVHIGNYYLTRNDTATAWDYYFRGIECDSIISVRKGYARIWTKQLYHTLLENLSENNTVAQARHWYDIYSKESAIIAENTKRDYNTQRGKAEAEILARRSLMIVFFILLVCVAVIVLLYFLQKQNKKLKKARTALGRRNEELEESQADLESLAKIGKHVVSTLEIDDDTRKAEFIDGIYHQIKELKVLSELPDLSFILYIKNNDSELQRYCKESLGSNVDISSHRMTDLERPAVGYFLKYGREILCFNDWNAEYGSYADKVGISRERIDPHRTISGNPTRSLAFINLYSKMGDKIGVLSFQTTELGAFRKPLLVASFEIIAEYIAAALDNAMQYQQLQFVQKKLIEQKRMELLTYVVRGISHELSQPLGSITQTLYDSFKDIETLDAKPGKLPEEQYRTIVKNLDADLRTISRSKDTISDLVNSFRNTIKENIIDPETEFNLSQKLDDIVKVIRPTIKSNINLEVDCDPTMVIRTFPLLFSQVMTNLISNANQHAFPNSEDPADTIRIVCKASGSNLVVKCTDNGVGIPESELDLLCQPFVSKKQTNLGLGLSLVKNIVEQYMKGEIGFSSGNGLTVTVTIPDCIIEQ